MDALNTCYGWAKNCSMSFLEGNKRRSDQDCHLEGLTKAYAQEATYLVPILRKKCFECTLKKKRM